MARSAKILPASDCSDPESRRSDSPGVVSASAVFDGARLEPGAPRETTGWHSRGYLPHFDSPSVIQHVTFHLADSLPADVRVRLDEELQAVPPDRQDAERRKRIEEWIDAGHGCCVLREPEAARLVQDAFLLFDGVRYQLLAWVVMPNHAHVLFEVVDGWTVGRIVASWKSFTGRRLATLMLAASPPAIAHRVWHREYWDRFIRDERHFHSVRDYIHNNPIKAGLVQRPEEWEWSSAWLEPGRG